MGAERIVAALDVGTSKVCCMIVALPSSAGREATIGRSVPGRLLGMGLQRSRGVKAGVIVDLGEAEEAIRSAVGRAEANAGLDVNEVYVTVSCGRLKAQSFSAHAAVAGPVVTEADIERAVVAGRAFAERDGRCLLHLHRLGYRLDGEDGIRNPRGMSGEKLSVALTAVTADEQPLRNLSLLIQRCYLSTAGLVAVPYASGLAALTEDETSGGTIVIDLGGGTSSLAVFGDGHLLHADVVALGGNIVTYDIARALQTPPHDAERIKTLYGNLIGAASDEHDLIPHAHADPARPGLQQTTRAQLRQIIRPRMEEILKLLADRLERSGFAAMPGSRVVLTGGASQLAGLREFAARQFRRPVRIAAPRPLIGMDPALANPAYASAIGIFHALIAPGTGFAVQGEEARLPRARGYLGRVSQWFKESFWDDVEETGVDGRRGGLG